MLEGWWSRRRCSMVSPRSAEQKDWHLLDLDLQAREVDMLGWWWWWFLVWWNLFFFSYFYERELGCLVCGDRVPCNVLKITD
jgi:hypothetical protein